MEIDVQQKKIKCSIREFAYGPISHHFTRTSAVPFYLRTQEGINLHQLYQKKVQKINAIQATEVKTEYTIKFKEQIDAWELSLHGRIDCVQETPSEIIIEEIKSVSSIQSFDQDSELAEFYIRQLQFYGRYYQLQDTTKKLTLHLILIELNTENIQIREIPLSDLSNLLKNQLEQFISEWETQELRKKQRQEQAETIIFPFSEYRPHQQEIIEQTWFCLENQKSFLLSAPTGLGKTIGTLLPALKFTLLHNQLLFAVTSKTTQQHVYQETLEAMDAAGGQFHSLILTAKEKMCINEEYLCDPSFCTYLANYEKMDLEPILFPLLKHAVLEQNRIRKAGRKYKICPFELALDLSLRCDIIVGDFNYVFSPQIHLKRFFDDKHDDIIVIVDEAHNLPNRARDYYSPEISEEDLHKITIFLQNQPLPRSLKSHGLKLMKDFQKFILSYAKLPEKNSSQFPFKDVYPIKIAQSTFKIHLTKLEKFSLQYAAGVKKQSGIPPLPSDDFLVFVQATHYFEKLLQERDKPEFSELFYLKAKKYKIFCKSAAEKLEAQVKGLYSVIAQSATLTPESYYQQMLGFPKDAIFREYPCPFPIQNRLYLTIPQISTLYRDRPSSYPEIAQIIYEVTETHIGNYLAFFPSFSYMHAVLKSIKSFNSSKTFLIQQQTMTEKDRKRFLTQLRQPERNKILFGVHGGIFSEGVDYKGKMAEGLFIISPGLPQYCLEQELMKQYFQSQYQKGFEYAYRNPGMTRVIQAAGRIFRSKHDLGFVILIGRRFVNPYYTSILPKDWELIATQNPKKNVVQFWQKSLFLTNFK